MKTTKICLSCREEIELQLFTKDKSRQDGFKSTCKKCYNNRTKDLQNSVRPTKNNEKSFFRDCPKCGGQIGYSTKSDMNRAESNLSKCKNCKNVIHEDKFKRNCPDCDVILEYERQSSFHNAVKNNARCKVCSIKNKSTSYNIVIENSTDIISLYCENGLSYSKIADMYGVCCESVFRFLSDNKITIRDSLSYIKLENVEKWSGITEINTNFWTHLKSSARKRKLDFTISKEYVIKIMHEQKYKCKLSGIELTIKPKRDGYGNASLDRIDSDFGYIENNIQFVDKDINIMKSNLSDSEFYELCKSVTFRNNFQIKEIPKISKIENTYWKNILYGAKIRNLDFTVSKDYLSELFKKQSGLCALTSAKIILPDGYKECRNGTRTASLDRIDSNLGYVEGNVWWVHKCINKMKMDLNLSRFLYLCESVYCYSKNSNLSWS